MSPDQFRKIAGQWLTGVTVVTSIDPDGHPHGMTMNAVTALSLEPPQFLICIDYGAKTLTAIRASGFFCINYLSEGQQEISTHFARAGAERFSELTYRVEQTGAPVLEGTLAFVECKVTDVHPGGDHAVVIGEAIHSDIFGGEPLGYFRGGYHKIAP
jgi:flavin reductase (DIM6/NTAB) family NADH-FMN oxidoreductase RutF